MAGTGAYLQHAVLLTAYQRPLLCFSILPGPRYGRWNWFTSITEISLPFRVPCDPTLSKRSHYKDCCIPGGARGKEPTCQRRRHETQVQSLGWEESLEKEMATHSSILAWRIPWIEHPGGLQSMGSHRVRHNWSDLAQQHSTESFIWFIWFWIFLCLWRPVWNIQCRDCLLLNLDKALK